MQTNINPCPNSFCNFIYTLDTMSTVHPFNNPEQVAKDLLEFKAMNWDNKTLSEITDEYIRRFQILPAYLLTIKAGTILFRARKNENKGDSMFHHLDELGLKPSDKVISLGRANIPGHSVFYCSNNEETVVKEVTQWYINDQGRAQDLFSKNVFGMNWNPWTSMMTISAWRVKEDLNLALLFGSESKRSEGIQNCAKQRFMLMDGEPEQFNRSRNLIIDFFSNEFAQLQVSNELQYLHSALYAFDTMTNQPHVEWRGITVDGVKYPSIANDFRGENYALSENAFKNKLDFLGANYCYTCNNTKPIMDVNATALIARINFALAKPSGELIWGESSDDFDYLAHFQGHYLPFTLRDVPNRFV